jgi:hypothetical protein
MAKEDCARAMDLAHKLFQLRAAEERVMELEADAGHSDRAARAEAWLPRIHNEVEQTFLKKDRDPRQSCAAGSLRAGAASPWSRGKPSKMFR